MKFNFFKKYLEHKKFYLTLLTVTLPIVLQNLIASSINMLDTVMIGKLGQSELASVGIANQYYFLFSLAIFGVAAGCGVFIAQLWGKKDVKNIKSTLGIGLISGLLITLVFVILGMIFPRKIMGIFSTDPKVIKLGRDYLLIVSVSYIFTAISFTYASALRSIRSSSLPMWASVGALFCNCILNYLLIFGKFGFPPLGVKGAAIATLIARATEVFIILYYVYTREHTLKASSHELFKSSKTMFINIFKVATPIILNDICFGLSTVTYAAIYGRISTEAIASIQICTTVFNLFLVFIYGLANSAVVIVGNEIGAGKNEQGILYANRITSLALEIGVVLALLLALITPYVVNVFNVSETVKNDAFIILIIYSMLMIPKVYNLLIIVGIFRGGGENIYGGVVQGLTSWFVGIPLAFFVAHILHLPIYYVVAFSSVEELLKTFILFKRYKSYKWIKNITKSFDDSVTI